ncbi:AmpG family muropeptide MFS transporter [Thalassotalea sp. PS06]|uniref:AmpG family muropeptide MFS transporter n=1 Tax=Thalassotalea sp. PS06 TaxID=2594005 RepID=UPI001164B4FD|nr:MFS transporter [Thalassotalea sp. PS06]QDP00689.1 AmpG family muropeptide MFS transporter [Thalassotalea sp. PS06]
MQSFRDTLTYFSNPKLLTIFCFGIASGFPWVLIGSAMTAWLTDEGLSRSSVGLFGLIFVSYSINFLWSPLVDRLRLPFIGEKLGQRRSWIFLTQIIIIACAFSLSLFDATSQLATMAVIGMCLAISSATQDIAIDAYRIDILDNDDASMAAGSAMATSGWWTGYAGLGAIPFLLVDHSELYWPQVYLVLTVIMAVLLITVLVVSEPQTNRQQQQDKIQQGFLQLVPSHPLLSSGIIACISLLIAIIAYAGFSFPLWPEQLIERSNAATYSSVFGIALLGLMFYLLKSLHRQPINSMATSSAIHANGFHRLIAWLLTTLVAPLHEFFTRNGTRFALSVLMFIFLFKLGEAYLGRMSLVFYKEVGYSNTDIAVFSKLMNWWVTILFSLIGSVFTIRFGIIKGLFIGGIAMAVSNLFFSIIALTGPSQWLLAVAVLIDGFTGAWGSVAFVALLSVLCNRTFTASQYALMASIGTFGRVALGSYSGVIVDSLDGNWALFFVLTALMVIPSLLFLYSIRKPLAKIIASNKQAS